MASDSVELGQPAPGVPPEVLDGADVASAFAELVAAVLDTQAPLVADMTFPRNGERD